MVFKKILVAIDRSPQAPVVFEHALELAQKEESSLMVFHCLSLETQGQSEPFIGIGTLVDVDIYGTFQRLHHESLQKDVAQIKGWLQTYCQQAQARGISAQLDCKVGDPGSGIALMAQTWGADLIVLGRRGRKGLAEIMLGSVSNYVVHHSSCSVLVVQGVTPPTVDTSADATSEKMSDPP